ncbi:MAG: putative Fe-S cluster assembly protein SufT [Gammaproteobacteria bacterium]|jgi:probable FeS assembly SUF system protein SufT|nr:putative Fe-S cluster assembly protein SufT [Gammaproteobacteria bacterium]
MYGKVCEPVRLTRDCAAVAVPEGVPVDLPRGTVGSLSQALGGSFTVYVQGKMFRIDGKDADALGREPLPVPELPPGATDADVERLVWEALRGCYDPELPVNVVDLGLIYECRIEPRPDGQRDVHITMTLTEPSCGMGEVMACDVRGRVERVPTVAEAQVSLVFEPRWTPDRMSDVAKLATGVY